MTDKFFSEICLSRFPALINWTNIGVFIGGLCLCHKYCRFGNFRENFIFANSILKDISDVKKIATKTRFTYINKRQSDFAIS